jgi:CRP-like cAMP-binding protein
MEKGAMFGEMSFLVSGCATASIIAEGSHVKIYVIEQKSLFLQFIHSPHLAGRFYSYLANILAARLSERELEINKKTEAHTARRRARSRTEDEKQ